MAAGATLLCTTSLSAVPVAAHADSIGGACPRVMVFGARGSGEPDGGNDQDGHSNLGPEVYRVYAELQADLPVTIPVAYDAAEYPAASVSVIATDTSQYFAGLDSGVNDVKNNLHYYAATCPDMRIVLAGYSQGAMVMHRVLDDLEADVNSFTLDHVDGVVLIGDGDNLSRDNETLSGGALPTARGIGTLYTSVSHTRTTVQPASLKDHVFRICHFQDIVCDTSPATKVVLAHTSGPVLAGVIAAGVAQHLTYANNNDSNIPNAAAAVTKTILSVPLVTPNPTVVSTVAGQPFSSQLQATSAGGVQWRVASGESLPAGVTLTSNGTVASAAADAAAHAFRVEVKSAINTWGSGLVQLSPNATAVQIATAVNQMVTRVGETFEDRTTTVPPNTSGWTLSSLTDGTGAIAVDDVLTINVTWLDGTVHTWSRDFSGGCGQIQGIAPVDLSTLLSTTGPNQVEVIGQDRCGGSESVPDLWLTPR